MKGSVLEFGEYQLRLLEEKDAEEYYKCGFESPDSESAYFTGTTGRFTKDQIMTYVSKVVRNPNRYDFLITREDAIIGEVVLTDIVNRNCHYRICLFNKAHFSKGIGFNTTRKVLQYAFQELGLESVELEVFPFNERGIALYKKLGFEITGERFDEEAEMPYRTIYEMRLTADQFHYLEE